MAHQITQILLVIVTGLVCAGAILVGFLAARKMIQRPLLAQLGNRQDLSEFIDVGLAGFIANFFPKRHKSKFWISFLFLEIFVGLIVLSLSWAALYAMLVSSEFDAITISLFFGAQILSFISTIVVIGGSISLFSSLRKRFLKKD
jgi:hypothetical protein